MAKKEPGCFGFVSTYNVNSKLCNACEFFQQCGYQAKIAVENLRDKVNVDALIKLMQQDKSKAKEEPKPVSSTLNKLTEGMPIHVARAVNQLVSHKVNHRKSLELGRNSMRGKSPKSMEILFDLVIKGRLSRDDYVQTLIDKGYSASTASSMASINLHATTAIGVLKKENDMYGVRRSK